MSGFNMGSLVQSIFVPVLGYLKSILVSVLGLGGSALVLFFLCFALFYRVRLNIDYLSKLHIRWLPYNFLRWVLVDMLLRKQRKSPEFREYCFTLFTGPQGSGKTLSMVEYLWRMKEKYPECIIVTNFGFDGADYRMTDWRQLFEIRNGEKGVIFAIDEIHSEYNSSAWKDFPEDLLSQISQQRKQRVKIVGTAQVFNRVVKQIREQSSSVVCCKSYFFGRLVSCREYDAAEYVTGDTPYMVRKKVKPIWKHWYVASDSLRQSYDTYEVVERMKQVDFIPRHERR